jgi:hypothetical protein
MGMIQNSLEGDEKERKLSGSAFPKTTTTRERKRKNFGLLCSCAFIQESPESIYEMGGFIEGKDR